MNKLIVGIMLCLFLSGCAGSVNLTRDTQGRITKIDASGPIEASGKTDKEEWSVDNKAESPLKEIVSFNALRSDK